MNRMVQILGNNLWRLPGLCLRLNRYAAHPEAYTSRERMAFLREVCGRILEGGHISLVTSGIERLPAEGGCVLYPNHQGLFDAVAVAAVVERPVAPVIKRELMDNPMLRRIFTCADAIPMDRDDLRQSLQVMREMESRVMAGGACLIFPEGTRSRLGNEMLDFKPGCFKPAVRTRCPIVPVALVDSFKPFDSQEKGPVTVRLHILKPLLWEDYRGMTTMEISQLVQEQIRQVIESDLS